jgi:hypothetical protein
MLLTSAFTTKVIFYITLVTSIIENYVLNVIGWIILIFGFFAIIFYPNRDSIKQKESKESVELELINVKLYYLLALVSILVGSFLIKNF